MHFQGEFGGLQASILVTIVILTGHIMHMLRSLGSPPHDRITPPPHHCASSFRSYSPPLLSPSSTGDPLTADYHLRARSPLSPHTKATVPGFLLYVFVTAKLVLNTYGNEEAPTPRSIVPQRASPHLKTRGSERRES